MQKSHRSIYPRLANPETVDEWPNNLTLYLSSIRCSVRGIGLYYEFDATVEPP